MGKFSGFRNDLGKAVLANSESKSGAKESKVFSPGSYELKIKAVEEYGPSKLDTDWLSYRIIFGGVGEKAISTFLNVPTADVSSPKLDGNYEGSTFKKLVRFLDALGVDISDVATALATYFETPDNLVGLHVKADIGYRGFHADYSKSEEGYKLLARDNSPYTDEVFPDRDAVRNYVEQKNLKGFKDFPDITSFARSETRNDVNKKTVPVKKPTAKTLPSGL